MGRIRQFIETHLDPVGRLGEIVFGLIMALGFTAAVRLGREEADNRALFVGILGCNIAWGIVDGVMYVLTSLYERGLRARVIRGVRNATSDQTARARVAEALDRHLVPLTTAQERQQIYERMVAITRGAALEKVRVRREDLLGGVAAGSVVVVATLPMVAPYLIFGNPHLAVRASHLTGLTLLFLVGASWGRDVGGQPAVDRCGPHPGWDGAGRSHRAFGGMHGGAEHVAPGGGWQRQSPVGVGVAVGPRGGGPAIPESHLLGRLNY